MADRAYITAGQFFTLLFVSRFSMIFLYAAPVSGLGSVHDWILPLFLLIPINFLLQLPLMRYSGQPGGTFLPLMNEPQSAVRGRVLILLYGVYFLASAVYSLGALFDFMKDVLPAGIHCKILLTLFLAGCLYAAMKGKEAVARMSLMILLLIIVGVFLLAAALIPGYSPAQLLPVRYSSAKTVSSGILFFISRMNGLAALTVLLPDIKGNRSRGVLVYNVLLIVFLFCLSLLLSGTADHYLFRQRFQVFRIIDASGVLQRLDPFYILVIVCSCFCNITLFLLTAALCFSKGIPSFSTKKACITSALILLAAMLFFPSEGNPAWLYHKVFWAAAAVCFVSLFPAVGLILQHRQKKHRIKIFDKKPVKIILPVFLVIMVLLSSTGCSGLQLNQRIIVQGIGLDRLQTGYQITCITLKTDEPDRENTVKVLQSEGESVEDALRHLERQTGKKILLNQCLFLLLNTAAAMEAEASLSCFLQSNDIPKTAKVMVTEEETVEILPQAVLKAGMSSEDIRLLTDSKAVAANVVSCTLFDFASGINTELPWMWFPSIHSDPIKKTLLVDGSYLVNYQKSGIFLSEKETDILLALKDYLSSWKRGIIRIDCSQKQLICRLNLKNFQKHPADVSDLLHRVIQEKQCDILGMIPLIRNGCPDVEPYGNDWSKALQNSELILYVE